MSSDLLAEVNRLKEINKELIEALEYILDGYIEDPNYASMDKSVQNAYRVLNKVGSNNED